MSHFKQSSICHSNRLKNNNSCDVRLCEAALQQLTQLAPFTVICTQQQITWSFQEIINKVRITVRGLCPVWSCSTFYGGKLLQFPVPAEVESWRTLSTLLLYNLRPTWVLNFVELSGRWSAVAGTLAGCLLGLEKKQTNTMFRIKMGTLCRSMPWHHFCSSCWWRTQ